MTCRSHRRFCPCDFFLRLKCLEVFVDIREEIQGVKENSSLSLGPDAGLWRCSRSQLFSRRKLGPDWQGTGLKSLRGGSALTGNLGLGLLTSWTAARPLFLRPQSLACAQLPGLGHTAYRATTETPGPVACESGPRTRVQRQHSGHWGCPGTVGVSDCAAPGSVRATHCRAGVRATPLPPTAAADEDANSAQLVTGPMAWSRPLPSSGLGFLRR